MICSHLNDTLRTGNNGFSEEELQSTPDCVLILFRYIDGKGAFEALYKKGLAWCLLYDKLASPDLEKGMISRLMKLSRKPKRRWALTILSRQHTIP